MTDSNRRKIELLDAIEQLREQVSTESFNSETPLKFEWDGEGNAKLSLHLRPTVSFIHVHLALKPAPEEPTGVKESARPRKARVG